MTTAISGLSLLSITLLSDNCEVIAHPSFRIMKRLGAFLLPPPPPGWDASPSQVTDQGASHNFQ